VGDVLQGAAVAMPASGTYKIHKPSGRLKNSGYSFKFHK
jgi:hypothetical protein